MSTFSKNTNEWGYSVYTQNEERVFGSFLLKKVFEGSQGTPRKHRRKFAREKDVSLFARELEKVSRLFLS